MKKSRPVSEKIRKMAEKFLSEFNLTFENLSEPQKDCLLRFIKDKIMLRYSVLISVVCIIFIIVSSFNLNSTLKFNVKTVAPNSVGVSVNGKISQIQLDQDGKEAVINYGMTCSIIGFVWGSIVYLLVTITIILTVVFVCNLRERKRMFESFLPSAKTGTPENRINI